MKDKRPSSFWRELPILVVIALGLAFLLKTFLIQAFYIPSGSMEDTLQIGDRVMVNKLAYTLGDIQRGDVIVFSGVDSWDPEIEVAETGNPVTRALASVAGAFGFASPNEKDYIKRVIGVPGDLIEYRDKKLSVNGQPVRLDNAGTYSYVGNGLSYVTAMVYQEHLNGVGHTMMAEPGKPSVYPPQVMDFPYRENCSYNAEGEGFACKVPAGHYFMMGDNRDASNDSRYWGFVPDRNIVGKAFFIWMNFDDFGRIGTTLK